VLQTSLAPDEIRVTFHAVTRYVQRVLRVKTKTPYGCSSKNVAELHCAAAATTIEKVKAAILCPAVILASRQGITMVTTARFQAVMTPTSSAIVTINGPRKPNAGKRLKVRTKREQQKDLKEITRRGQSRPSRRLRSPEDAI
jgi:hypothetical protein